MPSSTMPGPSQAFPGSQACTLYQQEPQSKTFRIDEVYIAYGCFRSHNFCECQNKLSALPCKFCEVSCTLRKFAKGSCRVTTDWTGRIGAVWLLAAHGT